MEMKFGRWATSPALRNKIGTPDVVWREDEVMNGHILFAGASGCGKTHNMRNVIRRLTASSTHKITFHVLDVHDDIDIDGASEVFFSESSNYGLNPLAVDPDIHTGGVRKAIQNFISTLNKTSAKIGVRQESVLRALLEELYAANGFYADDPSSWSLHDGKPRKRPKKFPTVDDLHRWAGFKYKQLFMGGSSKSVAALDRVNREAAKIQRAGKEVESDVRFEDAVADLKDKAIEAYTDYVISIKSGRELEELLKYDSKTTLKSVVDRIDNLRNCGVFKNDAPDFDPYNNVWRYRLKALATDEKKMFVLFKLKEIYDNALRRGPTKDIVEAVIVDEAAMFMDNDPENIINKMANEIRKFGVQLIFASQSFTHFADDFLASCATKVILGIDEMYWDKTARQLQINKKLLAWIQPRRSALISIKRTPRDPNDPTAKEKWFTTQLYP